MQKVDISLLCRFGFYFNLTSFSFPYNADPPGAPGSPQASETSVDSITLTWQKPRDDGGSPITGYVLEKRNKGKERWIAACQTTISDQTFRVTGLKENHEYEFRVAAVNAAGQGPFSSCSDGIFACPPPCMY